MSGSFETSHALEHEPMPSHTIEQDFRLPSGVEVPEGLNQAYQALPESAKDQELHNGIEAALAGLQSKIQKNQEQVRLNLEQLLYG